MEFSERQPSHRLTDWPTVDLSDAVHLSPAPHLYCLFVMLFDLSQIIWPKWEKWAQKFPIYMYFSKTLIAFLLVFPDLRSLCKLPNMWELFAFST